MQLTTDPNDAYNKLIETYNNILNTNMPLKKFKIKRSTNEKPWLTNEIIHDINRKNKMYTTIESSWRQILRNSLQKIQK